MRNKWLKNDVINSFYTIIIVSTGGREKGKEKLDFAPRTLTLNKQYLQSSHQIYNEKYYLLWIWFLYFILLNLTQVKFFKKDNLIFLENAINDY